MFAGRFFTSKAPTSSLLLLEEEELFLAMPLVAPPELLLLTKSESVLAKTCIQVSMNIPLLPPEVLAVPLLRSPPLPAFDLDTVGSSNASKSRCSSSSSQEYVCDMSNENSVFPARSETRLIDLDGEGGILLPLPPLPTPTDAPPLNPPPVADDLSTAVALPNLSPIALPIDATPSLELLTTVPKLYLGATPIASNTSCDMDPWAMMVRRISCETRRSTSTCAAVWDWSISKSSSLSSSSSSSSSASRSIVVWLEDPDVDLGRLNSRGCPCCRCVSRMICLPFSDFFFACRLLSRFIRTFLSTSSSSSATVMAASTCLTRLGSRKTSHSRAGLL
mmetsp:Transcript_2882/g.7322  ORF Transcript_2882/g.7322 Transcript_2882/m.7322 type:complete len:334 (-) Transcript_2882:658-1659(-)